MTSGSSPLATVGGTLLRPLVAALQVVAPQVRARQMPEAILADHQEVVQVLGPNALNYALANGLHDRGPNRGPDDLDAVGCQELAEAGGELGVIVQDFGVIPRNPPIPLRSRRPFGGACHPGAGRTRPPCPASGRRCPRSAPTR